MCCLSNKLKFGMIPHSFKNDPSNSISHFQHPSIFVLSDVQSTYFFVFVYLLRKVEQFSYSKLRSKTKVLSFSLFSFKKLNSLFFEWTNVWAGMKHITEEIGMKLSEEEDLNCYVVTVHSTFFGRMSQAAADFYLVISLKN